MSSSFADVNDVPNDIGIYQKFIIDENSGVNKKINRALRVSILTVDEKDTLHPIINVINNINEIVEKELFIISEIMSKENRNPNTDIKTDTDMVIIKGHRFMKHNITWFVFNIRDFIEEHGTQTVNEIYRELADGSYICRQYEWKQTDPHKGKFLAVLDDGLGWQNFIECSALLLLSAVGIFADPNRTEIVKKNNPYDVVLSYRLSGELITALKILYDDRVKRGQSLDEIKNALEIN
jgi:hypothetical protein